MVVAGFDEFWRNYPRRIAKRTAALAYEKAIKRGASEADILAGAMRFSAHVQEQATEDRFIPHPATWLNGDRWCDELKGGNICGQAAKRSAITAVVDRLLDEHGTDQTPCHEMRQDTARLLSFRGRK